MLTDVQEQAILALLANMECQVQDHAYDCGRMETALTETSRQLEASQAQVMDLATKLKALHRKTPGDVFADSATAAAAMDSELDAMRGRFEGLVRKAFQERGMEGEGADKLLDHMLRGYDESWGRKTDDDLLKRRLHELGYVLPSDQDEQRRQETAE